ncbi:UNVERIFIED_CONTAM: hypothetical protein FKN15_009856 [Acipenser sinensis]
MTSASSYVQSMTCRYSPWAEREILCERNYMEVSVRRGVPLIEPNFVQDDPDWSLAYPESHVLDNTYVISYSIEPMLEHTWQDGPEKTKYTVLHPITTPFMPRPPVVTNNTVPKARVFNVTLGTFLPDVELVKIIVGPETLTVPEANLKGYNVQEHVFPNGSKTYTLQVPFEDPNVKQKIWIIRYRGNSFQVKYGNLEEEGITQYHSVEKERVLDEGLVVKECICLGEGIKQSRVEGPEQLKSGKAASAPYARSLLEDSEELGDDDYQASKRELDLSNTVEESEEQEGALENTRALVDSEVVLTQSMVVKKDALSKRYYRMYSEVVLTQSMVVKKDALSKRHYRTWSLQIVSMKFVLDLLSVNGAGAPETRLFSEEKRSLGAPPGFCRYQARLLLKPELLDLQFRVTLPPIETDSIVGL